MHKKPLHCSYGSTTTATNRKGRGNHTYGVQNAASHQYCKGFPFVKQHTLLSSRLSLIGAPFHCNCASPKSEQNELVSTGAELQQLLVLTLCPPHNMECDAAPDDIISPRGMSFDLGFTVMEKNNEAYVMSVAQSSPAMVAGVRPLYKVKFAFEQTLSSPFHFSDEAASTFGSVSFLSSTAPEIAVCHPSEHESKEAAEYALECARNGQQTSFLSFVKMFPFDVTKPFHCYKPAIFEGDKDPILYPVTIVFEKNSMNPKRIQQEEETTDNFNMFSLINIPFSKLMFCLKS